MLVPNEKDRQRVRQVIYVELCLGILSEESRRTYLRIIAELAAQGVEAVILGWTELGLLINQRAILVP